MIALGALAHALQQFVVFLHQRADERAVMRREQGQELGEGGIVRLVHRLRELLLERLAFFARGLDRGALGVDGGDRVQDVIRAALIDQLLLVVQQGQHLAILLQLVAQRFDQFLQYGHYLEFQSFGAKQRLLPRARRLNQGVFAGLASLWADSRTVPT